MRETNINMPVLTASLISLRKLFDFPDVADGAPGAMLACDPSARQLLWGEWRHLVWRSGEALLDPCQEGERPAKSQMRRRIDGLGGIMGLPKIWTSRET